MSGTVAIVPRGGKRMKYNGQVINDGWIDTRKLLMVWPLITFESKR